MIPWRHHGYGINMQQCQCGCVCHNPDPRFMLFVVKRSIKKISRNKLCYPLHSCNILWLLSCYDEVSSSNVFISRLGLYCLKVSRLSSESYIAANQAYTGISQIFMQRFHILMPFSFSQIYRR